MIIAQFSEGVDEMGTQAGVYVLRHKLSDSMSVLRPVGVVTHSPLAGRARSSAWHVNEKYTQ